MRSPFSLLEALFELALDTAEAIPLSVAVALGRLTGAPRRQWIIRDLEVGYRAEACWPIEELDRQLDKAWDCLSTQASQQ